MNTIPFFASLSSLIKLILLLSAASGCTGVVTFEIITPPSESPTSDSTVGTQKEADNDTIFKPAGPGSKILSNPYGGGCVRAVLNGDKARYYENKYRLMGTSSPVYQLYERLKTSGQRICNSDDDQLAKASNKCSSRSDLNEEYAEVRIAAQDWESSIFLSWLIQIFLSEFLQVPSTIETGAPNKRLSFYDPDNAIDFGVVANFEALKNADRVGGDCSRVTLTDGCAHVIPELWSQVHEQEVLELQEQGIIEPSKPLGMAAQQGWYITKWTLTGTYWNTWNDLQGEHNRQKLAKMFRRPTTWGDYCALVSRDNCTTPTSTASRPPLEASEMDRMFVEGLYTGHFRATDQNNCTLYPYSCTGYIADFPCHWGSFVVPQCYHNQIALQSTEHTYSQLTEIWKAANATKSDFIGVWWEPSALVEQLSDVIVSLSNHLPRPTQECVENRIDTRHRCDSNATFQELFGAPTGACQDNSNAPEMVMAKALYEQVYHRQGGVSEARTSPAYDAINAFKVSQLQIQEVLAAWDTPQSDPRTTTCHWVADNLDFLRQFVPRGFPRVIEDLSVRSNRLFYAAIAFGSFSTTYVVLAMVLTLKRRDDPVVKYAQVEFLLLLLVGFLMVSIASLVVASEPTLAGCLAPPWLITLGYTLQTVPTIIKVAAISHLVGAARKMRRVTLDKTVLFGAVAGLCFAMAIFCTVWTAVDPPRSTKDFHMSKDTMVSEQGEHIVYETHYCTSSSHVWKYISALSHFLMLLVAAVLTYEMRSFHNKVNESQTLAVMVYSSCVFLILRVLVYVLEESWPDHVALAEVQSLIYSIDTIASITIYFLPKFLANNDDDMWHSSGGVKDTVNCATPSNGRGRQVRFLRGEGERDSITFHLSDVSEGQKTPAQQPDSGETNFMDEDDMEIR